MRKSRHILLMFVASLMVTLLSCGQKSSETDAKDIDVLVQVNDSILTLNDVLKQIPSGLESADSAKMFQHTVDKWVERMVLREVAEKNIPDLASIDEMVERYRDNLIVTRYLSMMEEKGVKDIPEERIHEYYEAHKDVMTLEEPLVQGIFIKTSAEAEDLQKLRKWLSSSSDDDVDNIEKYGLRQASQYKYFKDTWMPWHAIAELIPYRFFDADAFVSSTKDFETEYGGSVYLLKLTKVMLSGQQTPYEYAKEEIKNMLRTDDMVQYRKQLLKTIYTQAIENGTLQTGSYDPVSGSMKKTETDKNQKNKKK